MKCLSAASSSSPPTTLWFLLFRRMPTSSRYAGPQFTHPHPRCPLPTRMTHSRILASVCSQMGEISVRPHHCFGLHPSSYAATLLLDSHPLCSLSRSQMMPEGLVKISSSLYESILPLVRTQVESQVRATRRA